MKMVRLLVCTLACVGFAPAASAQLVRVPHTFISLSPPPGFSATRAFGGFENRRAGWVIEVLELGPGLWPGYAAAFSSPERATAMFDVNGIRITRIEQLALDSGEVPLAIGVSKALGRETLTYIALMGDRGTATVLITFGLSRSSTLGRSDVEAVLRSVKIDTPTTLAEWLALLPFTFREVPPFHTTNAGHRSVLLEVFDDGDPSAMRLAIKIDRSPFDPHPDPATTARTAAQRNASLIGGALNGRKATIVEQRAVAFAGGPGDFIMAAAEDGRTVFHFLRVLPDHTYVRLSAAGESRAIEAAREAVMEIAMSVEPRAFAPAE